jgi:hypothetical protein
MLLGGAGRSTAGDDALVALTPISGNAAKGTTKEPWPCEVVDVKCEQTLADSDIPSSGGSSCAVSKDS